MTFLILNMKIDYGMMLVGVFLMKKCITFRCIKPTIG